MLSVWKTEWHQFKSGKPGQRFQERYQRLQREKFSERAMHSFVGVVLLLVGLALIPLPGPGAIIMLFGLSLVGSEFRPVAEWLDRTELKLRPIFERGQKLWESTSLSMKVIAGVVALVFAAAIGIGVWNWVY
jgi:uncharacterized protein (TIGR02611 family)